MKLLRCILLLTLATTLLAGCSAPPVQQTAAPTAAPAAQPTAATAKPAAATAAPATSAPTAPPKAAEKPVLKFLHPETSFDINGDASLKVLCEATGYTIKYDTFAGLDKLNLLMSSGDMDYDFVHMLYMGGEDSKSVYASYAKRGQLLQLDELLPKYPNITKRPALDWEPVKVDGKIYALPTTGTIYPEQTNFYRKDWLDALGKQVPTTRDELYDLLKLVKEKDPGKLGDMLVPFGAAAGFKNNLSTTFGFLYPIENVGGTIVDHRILPEYKEYLSFMSRLYQEKLLDQDYPVIAGGDANKKIVAGQVFYHSGWTDPVRDFHIAMDKEGKTSARIKAGPPLKSPDGALRAANHAGFQDYGFIPKSSKNAAAVLDFVNTELDEKTFEFIVNGVEGQDYTVKDGMRFPINPRFNDMRGNLYAYNVAVNGEAYYPLWIMRTRKQIEYWDVFADIIANCAEYASYHDVTKFAPALPKTAQVRKIIDDYITQETIKFIAGARPLAEFDKYVEEVKSKGIGEVVDEMNNWYKGSGLK